MNDQTTLHFYASTPEACGYLPGQQSISAFANPHIDMDVKTYDELIQFGFRRSGGYLYRPHCPDCKECVSIRIPVAQYQFSRNDKRSLRKNKDLVIQQLDGKFVEEHFDLYQRYINSRHIGGSMENPSRSDYHRFLICDWTDTTFIEFRLNRKLVAIAVADFLEDGQSAIYTFFDPFQAKRSLGTYTLLWQVENAANLELDYLYLGYWIRDCQKMAYKADYRPLELRVNNRWTAI